MGLALNDLIEAASVRDPCRREGECVEPPRTGDLEADISAIIA